MFMPPWMDRASNISPVKWAIRALEGGIWRDFSIGEMALPCTILLGMGLLCGLIGVAVHQKRG